MVPRHETSSKRGTKSWGAYGRRMTRALVAILLVVLPATTACGQDTTAPDLDDAESRILFIGNSLTYENDLPGAVATVAGAVGRDVSVASVAWPNYALEDHWYDGIADVIRTLTPDVVVMQQGPSSLPESQVHLATWADSLSRVVKEIGGTPAMMMVWPPPGYSFDAVRDSYRGAAEKIDGVFIPAGEALRALSVRAPGTSPYGPDAFHPSDAGTVLAAYVVVGTLFDDPVAGLDARLSARNGGRSIDVRGADLAVMQGIADSVVAAWR